MTHLWRSSRGRDEQEEQREDEAPRTSGDLSRRALLGRSAAVAAVAVPVGVLAARSFGQSAQAQSAQVAANARPLQPLHPLANINAAFQEIQTDENAHVAFLKGALASSARPAPTFKGLEQSSVAAFESLSFTFENVGVGAYLLGASAITSKDILLKAATILTVEARHSGFLGYLTGKPLSPSGAFDAPLTQAQIVSDVSPFIASLNGGPDPAGKLGSDTDILNFALLLEYLEAAFYNINVPKFFGGSVPGNG